MSLSFTGSSLARPPLQSWHESFSSVWTTSIRSVWRIPTHCWSRAPRCSTCGPPGRARGQRVSGTVTFPLKKRYLILFVQVKPCPVLLTPSPLCLCSGELVHGSEEYRPHGHRQHVGGPASSASQGGLPWHQQAPTRTRAPLPWYDQWWVQAPISYSSPHPRLALTLRNVFKTHTNVPQRVRWGLFDWHMIDTAFLRTTAPSTCRRTQDTPTGLQPL